MIRNSCDAYLRAQATRDRLEEIVEEIKEKPEQCTVKIYPDLNASLEEFLKQDKEYQEKRLATVRNYRIK